VTFFFPVNKLRLQARQLGGGVVAHGAARRFGRGGPLDDHRERRGLPAHTHQEPT
jgi:hypothetical protein